MEIINAINEKLSSFKKSFITKFGKGLDKGYYFLQIKTAPLNKEEQEFVTMY